MEEKCIYKPENNNLHDFFESFPPGYRFSPEDHELVLDYLEKRVRNEKLPENNFVHINIYDYHPETLARQFRHFGVPELYCFTPRERKYKNGERPRRGAAGGFWKATGADKQVLFNKKVVGHKKSLVFYDGKPPNGEKTNWIMHEYRLADPSRVPAKDRYPDTMQLDDCVLCKIYKKVDRKVVVPRKQGNQVEAQADANAKEPKEEDETEKVDPLVETLDDRGPFTDDSIEDHGLNPNGSDQYQHYSMANYDHNHFSHQSGHTNTFPSTRDLPPLPLQMAYIDQFGFGFSQQDLRMNSSLNLSTSLSNFENPYLSVLQNFQGDIDPPMPSSLQCNGPLTEGFSAYRNHVSPFRTPGFEASTSNPFHSGGFDEFVAPSSCTLLQEFNMGSQVDLHAISPMLFQNNDHNNSSNQPVCPDPSMPMASAGPPPPVKKFRQQMG